MLPQNAGTAPKTTATGNSGSAFAQQHQKQQLTNDMPPPLPKNIRIIERPHGHATTFNLAGHCLAQHEQLPPHPQDTTNTDTLNIRRNFTTGYAEAQVYPRVGILDRLPKESGKQKPKKKQQKTAKT